MAPSRRALDILHLKALLADDEFRLRRAKSARPDGRYWLRRREIELRLASRRVQLALLEHEHERAGGGRGGYDPNQPRVPPGNLDGGQWTSTGGTPSGIGTAGISGHGVADTPWSGGDWHPTDVSAAKKRRQRRERPPPPQGGPFKEFWQAIQDFREST
jgi:hypothetical protein